MSSPLEVPPALDGERLDRAVALLSGRSRAEVASLVEAGGILLDGEAVRLRSRRVRAGELLEIAPAPEVQEELEPAAPGEVAYRIVHEDPALLIVDKPAGVVVHPGAGNPRGTLIQGLLAAYPDLGQLAAAGVGEPGRPGIVHRLDKETSGLLVVARTASAFEDLVDQLASRTMGRGYVALALGAFEAEEGLVEAPIGRSSRDPTRMAVRAGGREARTRYRVLHRYETPVPASMLELELETGRTHQIRVHLRAINHPVAGDRRYGGASPALALNRPFLHAADLRLTHPMSGEPEEWHSPLPDELQSVLARLA